MTEKKHKRKSESALRTIGEVSEEMDLPPHVLRFWESKFNEIKPQKRRGGHRYYRPQDIEILQEIKHLLYDKGFTIKGAQKFFKERRSIERLREEHITESDNNAPSQSAHIMHNNAHTSAAAPPNLSLILSELVEIKQLLSD